MNDEERYRATVQGVSDAMDFWLSQHPVSFGDMIEAGVEHAMAKGVCNDPNHSEPFACYRQAEGGFVCESTHRLEALLAAVQQLEHLVEVELPASAVDLLHPALVSLLDAAKEARS